jgi:CRP-like cAMP-binding protein
MPVQSASITAQCGPAGGEQEETAPRTPNTDVQARIPTGKHWSKENVMKLEEAIQQSYLVRGLSEGQIAAIVAIAEQRIYADREFLMRQGDDSTDIMILAEGTARVVNRQNERIVDIETGGVVGEIAMLDAAPRSATVVSVGPTLVAVLAYDKLNALMQANKDIELGILRNLSKELCAYIRRSNVRVEKAGAVYLWAKRQPMGKP